MLEKITTFFSVICIFVLLAFVINLEQSGRLDNLFSWKDGNSILTCDLPKYMCYFLCLAVPLGLEVFLPNWISLTVFIAIVFLYVGYKIGRSKSGSNGGDTQ